MAIIRDINGQVLEHIYADLEGYVIGWDDHITRYEGGKNKSNSTDN